MAGVAPSPCIRILQIHPTRRCNLRCRHCYSSSGPREAEELPAERLCEAVRDASTEGYSVAGFSGGEPLLYPGLPRVLAEAKRRGMVTTVTSNGTLLSAARLRRIEGVADLLAISIDGIPASHDRLRASSSAFARMQARLADVRSSGISFGFIFTLTQHNLDELDWVARFAVEQGASLLQIHPLEMEGRASVRMKHAALDDVEMAYAYLEATRIRDVYGSRMLVQLDAFDRDQLRADPARVFADGRSGDPIDRPFSECVAPLVIEANGTVVPIRHGFHRRLALGNILETPLSELMSDWRRRRYGDFLTHCRRVFGEVVSSAELPFTNWYEAVAGPARRGQHA